MLSAYEKKEWERLQERKDNALGKKPRKLLPIGARERLSAAAEKTKNAPGADKVIAAYTTAAQGLGKATGSTATRTVSAKSVIKRYQKAGYEVSELSDIRELDLKAVDSVAKLARIRYGHSLTAAAGGIGSAAAVTGGTVLASAGGIAGAGAGAAPGFGTVATALLADAAGVLGLSARVAAATALYYGYDPHRHEEEIFMMSVIGLGMATEASAKTAAYAQLSQLTQLLARNASWAKLNEKVLTQITQQFAARFSVQLTKKKFGQFVPVAGMLFGAGANFAVIDRIAVAADNAYRERFLVEKSGGDLTGTVEADRDSPQADDDAIDLIELLREEDVLPPSDPGSQQGGSASGSGS
ncbi:EcsC family protein [Actinomadura formosensis]|uniref:EcsC family protein n=1 Tax=Actinomadura formosensis TaxID=60706 RepID=UPI000A9D51E7|nr:EcsC family protein [Actinomadura formosensis]